jgi:hypothetical protein
MNMDLLERALRARREKVKVRGMARLAAKPRINVL